MTWTFDSGVSTNKDKVRLLVGDTVATDPQLQDEQISFLLVGTSLREAAARACEAIAAHYARQVTSGVAHLTVAKSERQAHYLTLAGTLRSQSRLQGAVPFAGGISRGDKQNRELDSDRLGSPVATAMFDNPAADAIDPLTDPYINR